MRLSKERTDGVLLQHMGEYSWSVQESGDSSGVMFLPVDLFSLYSLFFVKVRTYTGTSPWS